MHWENIFWHLLLHLPLCEGVRDDVRLEVAGYAEGIEDELSNSVIINAHLAYAALHPSDFGLQYPPSRLERVLETNGFFTQCNQADAALFELKQVKLQLHGIGQLAKSGDFFVSDDKKWLVKAIKTSEQSVLHQLSTIRLDNGNLDCEQFHHSLLLPISLVFRGSDKRTYLVMRNETQRLEELGAKYWQVLPPFDVKPLPNLSDELPKLVEELVGPWIGSLVPLKDWLGWDVVRSRLKRDFELLGNHELVDFSLFVHLLRPIVLTSEQSSSGELSEEAGCIREPRQRAMICFSILDFLLRLSVGRKLESKSKEDKFGGYVSKMLQAVDCLGELHGNGCERYRDYGSILSAGNDDEKGVLVGTASFSKEYTCMVERPLLRYALHKYSLVSGGVGRAGAPGGRVMMKVGTSITDKPWRTSTGTGVFVHGQERVEMVPEPLQSLSYHDSAYEPSVAGLLKDMCEQANGARIAGHGFIRILEEEHNTSTSLSLSGDEFNACKEGIREFATSSMIGQKHANLGNILWSPQHRSLLVVRGKSKFYSRDKVAMNMKSRHCFMLARYYHCQAASGARMIFDYTRKFGPVEVLQVVPSIAAPELATYRQIVELGLLKA